MHQDNLDLDVLQQQWAERDRKLDVSVRLNRQILREMCIPRARRALWRLGAMLAAGSLFWLTIVVWLGMYIGRYGSALRFLWPGVFLEVLALSALAGLIVQIGWALSVKYDQPVARIQKRLETLRMFRLRYVQGICVAMILTWAPILIIVWKVFFGTDAYRLYGVSGIVWNVLIGFAPGLACVLLWVSVSRKYGRRIGDSAFSRRFMRDIGGYNLNTAAGFLATLAKFEDENDQG